MADYIFWLSSHGFLFAVNALLIPAEVRAQTEHQVGKRTRVHAPEQSKVPILLTTNSVPSQADLIRLNNGGIGGKVSI